MLVSRGLQLANQVQTEELDLQGLVARLEKTSPLQHLSTSNLKHRSSEAISHCQVKYHNSCSNFLHSFKSYIHTVFAFSQEILGMLGSLGLKQEVGEFAKNQPAFETAFQTHRQSEMGLLVVARTKHVDNTGNVMLRSQHSDQLSARDLHDGKDVVAPNITRSPPVNLLVPAAKEAEASFSKSPALASGFSPNNHLPAAGPAPVRIKCSEIPVRSKRGASSLLQLHTEHEGAGPSNKPPQPPVVVHSEVHSRAQSMARSRLEKARFRLQGRLQQAMKLFGGKVISESEAKKKQVQTSTVTFYCLLKKKCTKVNE